MPPLDKQVADLVINKYSFSQNYPNPFNPSTKIIYSLPVSDYVNIKVFDIIGKEVAVLVTGWKEAGSHMVEFDASNLTSGIYFYQIQTEQFLETRKLMLQK